MGQVEDTIERLKFLEVEKENLLVEVEELKKMANEKALDLENEVEALHYQVSGLKLLIAKSEKAESEVTSEPELSADQTSKIIKPQRSRFRALLDRATEWI